MGNVRRILFSKGITLSEFASKIRVSRPTLNTYISIYEKGGTISKEKYDIVFKTLFDEEKSDSEFDYALTSFTDMLERDETMGIIDLDAESTDLFNSTIRTMKNDFKSDDFDANIYKFINMLISGYHKESIYNHLVNYFMILNGIKDYKDIDFYDDSYLLHYFELFTKDKRQLLQYDRDLHINFINRIKAIEREKQMQTNYAKKKLVSLMTTEIDKLNNLGIEMSNEELLAYLKKKLESE